MSGGKQPFGHLIKFVSQQTQAGQATGQKEECSSSECVDSDLGTDVRTFYETVINENPSQNDSNEALSITKEKFKVTRGPTRNFKNKLKRASSKGQPKLPLTSTFVQKQRLTHQLLQAVQTGQVELAASLLQEGADVNCQDFYGWTPLMCAANEGLADMVKYLLQQDADRMMCNYQDQTAQDLAHSRGHKEIVNLIFNFLPGETAWNNTPLTSGLTLKSTDSLHSVSCEESDKFLCETCKSEFSLSEESSHQTSTVHLFNTGHKTKTPSYLLPESNKGFQMLLKTGWDCNQGLGPTGSGQKYPVKTVLKYDRTGLGSQDSLRKKAKITHFDPHDSRAIVSNSQPPKRKVSVRKLAARAMKRQEQKDKELERQLRLEFRDNF